LTPQTIGEAPASLETGLKALAARYLLNETHPKGGPLDPVARFHLGNGASLKAMHWRGDVSTKGLRNSAGIMVNYLYDLKTVDTNHEVFSKTGKVIASREIQNLLDPKLDAAAQTRKRNA
jgi:malonyl-CoA decarboxylase